MMTILSRSLSEFSNSLLDGALVSVFVWRMDPSSDQEWERYRELGHQAIDLVVNDLRDLRSAPVW
jgi:hypothetical protein